MHTSKKFLLIAAFAIFGASVAPAQSLTTIADTVRNADNSLFSGTAVITWTGSSAASSGSSVPYSTSVRIYNGVLSVSLVPNVGISAFYLVVYNSSDGRTSWVENWQVGPSSVALTIAQVKVPLSTSTSTSTGTAVGISQVTGLNSYLNALSSSISTVSASISGYNSSVNTLSSSVSQLSDRVTVLQANVSNPSSATLIDAEVPAGPINGTNASFTLASTPVSSSSVTVFSNGILQSGGNDYSIAGKVITFALLSIPQNGDKVQVSYRVGTVAQSAGFVDNETPTGVSNGSNLSFTLSGLPVSNTLRLYKNGALLVSGADYAVGGATITFLNAVSTPGVGDTLRAYYRIATP